MKTLQNIINELRANGRKDIEYGVTIEEAAQNMLNGLLREEKEKEKEESLGLKTILYSEYKTITEYSRYPTMKNSYDKKNKTIVIITKANQMNICPKCGTVCYGDCEY